MVRRWGMLCHLSALLALVGVPLGNLVGPLIVWLMKKNEFPFVDAQGKESLNFQMSMTLYGVVAAAASVILIGIPFLVAVVLADLVLVVVAALKVGNGEPFRYPFTLKILQ